ncbi:MAG: aspartate-semialdehyde dehydrogenase [Candidatus Omnitrophica bacterium]|nr:aspartate-semialdehyde dehydrogenase [Candidatus Omnitrophota bacterium]MBU4140652.1 aspartate-semialdehyde dehydrogenase [Candidatus Omnitrophota bacterium]
MKRYNVAVVGVGAVGEEMLRVLRQRNFPINELRVFARSAREIIVDNQKYSVRKIKPEGFQGVDIALFAGTEGEKGAAVTYAPAAVKRGALVIDNGADFRLKKGVPLVVPEVNPQDAKRHKGIIANPNCSTIQLVAACAPIYKAVGIKRMVVSTYQAASGAGRAAVDELIRQSREFLANGAVGEARALPARIAFNVFPQIGSFGEAGYTTEEWKTVRETQKILHDKKIKITSTTARVPVVTGHSQAVYLETARKISAAKARELLRKAKGIKVVDRAKGKGGRTYPQAIDAAGRDEVLVGRLRQDPFVKNGLWLWVAADNLRKGAALNAVQIAELVCAISS